MIEKLIEIAVQKLGSKRQVGIVLGFDEKYAGQGIVKLEKHQNPKWSTLEKLLMIAEIDQGFRNLIEEKYNEKF